MTDNEWYEQEMLKRKQLDAALTDARIEYRKLADQQHDMILKQREVEDRMFDLDKEISKLNISAINNPT